MKIRVSLLFVVVAFAFPALVFSGEPLKVFILAGQSNMVGQGEMSPLETQGTIALQTLMILRRWPLPG